MNLVSTEDINYLAEQSTGKLNMILSGMTALMNDNSNKLEVMESQNWFQRMIKTVTGKNKATQMEIKQNHDKLNAYMSEAIAELYNRNCIDEQIMIALGNQLNELYSEHVQLKQMLGAFVNKLNEKIESVDNFHMLIEEISQGMYEDRYPILSVVNVLSMMDKRMILDKRKCDIVIKALRNNNILNTNEITLLDCFNHVMNLDENEIGRFYLEVETLKGNFFADMILNLMDKLYFLTQSEQYFFHKNREIKRILREEDYDEMSTLTTEDIFDEFLSAKKSIVQGFLPIAEVQYDEKLHEAEQLYLSCKLNEAFEIFKTLSEKGNSRAMYFMGEYYIQGYTPVSKDYEEGEKWRQKGCDLGDVLASLNMAYLLPEGSDERKDIFFKMFESTLKLAEEGDIFAQNELADLYLGGYGTDKNTYEGMNWLKKSAESGFWRSTDKLGDAYYYGNSVDQDYEKAVDYYRRGAEVGYSRSEYNLGYCYYMGYGVEEDNEKALEYFKAAYEHGNAEAANMIGIMYHNGYGVEQDNEQEFIWIKKSADMGCVQAISNLGDCYYNGTGTSQNYEMAKSCYIKAADAGNDYAATQIGIMAVESHDYTEAVKWFMQAANNGYADAQNRLGVRYDNGEGVTQNKAEAVKWYMKAAEQGHTKAQSNLGYCYYYGDGIEENDEEAKKWLEKSAEQGYEVAINNLREWFGEYYGETKTIMPETLDTIKAACESFIIMHDGARFDATYKLKDNLNILYCDEVYLGHDDTLFGSGKNGFAITSDGIYCRELMSSYISYVSYEELANSNNIYYNGSNVYADNKVLAYITGSKSELEDVVSLFEEIKLFVSFDFI